MFDKESESGVSPVIGVILMVAVTVALVALVTVVVFDLGGDVSDSPDATVQLEQDESNFEVTATLLRNENVQELYLSDASGEASGNRMQNAGDTMTLTKSIGASGTANVIAVMPDGNEEVLTSTDYNF